MKCRECSDELSAFLDGELADPAFQEMRRHLEKCRPCNEEYLGLKRSSEFMESHAPVLEPVPEIWNNLRERVASMPAPSDTYGFFRFLTLNRWVTAAVTLAATIAIALGLWSYMRYQQDRRELMQYMTDYIQTRELQEKMQQIQNADAARDGTEAEFSDHSYNPFAVTQPASFTSPFRAEEK